MRNVNCSSGVQQQGPLPECTRWAPVRVLPNTPPHRIAVSLSDSCGFWHNRAGTRVRYVKRLLAWRGAGLDPGIYPSARTRSSTYFVNSLAGVVYPHLRPESCWLLLRYPTARPAAGRHFATLGWKYSGFSSSLHQVQSCQTPLAVTHTGDNFTSLTKH